MSHRNNEQRNALPLRRQNVAESLRIESFIADLQQTLDEVSTAFKSAEEELTEDGKANKLEITAEIAQECVYRLQKVGR